MRIRVRRAIAFIAMSIGLTAAAVLVTGTAAQASPPAPDTWLWCYNNVPNGYNYGGIYANPNFNSYNTTCRDWANVEGWILYFSRPVQWGPACRLTYGSQAWASVSNGQVWCNNTGF